MFTLLVTALIKSKNVQLHKLAEYIPTAAKPASSLRRVERFFLNTGFDQEALTRWLVNQLPEGPVDLCVDRTNWKFGKMHLNFLVITARVNGMGFPLCFSLLDNRGGASSERQRLDLLQKLEKVLPWQRVRAFYADREFGGQWLKHLKNDCLFYIRIPSHHLITIGRKVQSGELWIKQGCCFKGKKAWVYGLKVRVSLARARDTNGRRDYLIIITNSRHGGIASQYRKRWNIEVFFQCLKKRGFNLEDTHIKDLHKLEKLFALVCVAFVVCQQMGWRYHQIVQQIKKKKHGYKSNSFFRKGLDLLNGYFCQAIRSIGQELMTFWELCWEVPPFNWWKLSDNESFSKSVG